MISSLMSHLRLSVHRFILEGRMEISFIAAEDAIEDQAASLVLSGRF